VLDDWSDDLAKIILRNIVPAMVKSRSRLLLAEVVMPPVGASLYASLMDINMMRYSGMNRKESQWRELLQDVGLQIVKIWPPGYHDSIIEATLAG
jgi:fumagillin biosynthesis methyltransferase